MVGLRSPRRFLTQPGRTWESTIYISFVAATIMPITTKMTMKICVQTQNGDMSTGYGATTPVVARGTIA
jgi:hypothetical protein